VYLTLEQGSQPGDTSVSIQAFVRPMILWLWIGGLVMGVGTLLAAFPGNKRRRATDPVSAPIATGRPDVQRPEGEPEPEPAGASA
jgi:cytochrome c-type biogenesis protein CcmF